MQKFFFDIHVFEGLMMGGMCCIFLFWKTNEIFWGMRVFASNQSFSLLCPKY
jgi:hypothetical protein